MFRLLYFGALLSLAAPLLVSQASTASADDQAGQWVFGQDTTPVAQNPPIHLPGINPFNFAHQSDLLGSLLPSNPLGALPDPSTLVPAGLLTGTLSQLLPKVADLAATTGTMLASAVPTIKTLASSLQSTVAATNLGAAASALAQLAPKLSLTIAMPASLPTQYSMTLTDASGTSTVSGQICAPLSATWPGSSLPNESVVFCPNVAQAIDGVAQWNGVGTPPAGTMQIDYEIPPIPQILPNGSVAHLKMVSGSDPFPVTAALHTHLVQTVGTYNQAANLTITSQKATAVDPAPLAEASLSLDGYGKVAVTQFPGGTSTLTLQYAQDGSFDANLHQTNLGPSQTIQVWKYSGASTVAYASFNAIPKNFDYSVAITYQNINGTAKANGIRAQGTLDTPGMAADFKEYDSNGTQTAELYQRSMPTSFDKALNVQWDASGQNPVKIHTDQHNVMPSASDLIAIGRWVSGALDSTVEAGGASTSTTFDLTISYDQNSRPIGFSVAGNNATDTNAFVFDAAQYGGGVQQRIKIAQAGAQPTFFYPGAGTATDFSLSGLDPNFSFNIQPSSSSTDVSVNSASQTGVTIDVAMGSDRINGVAQLSTVDSAGTRLGFLIKQIPTSLHLAIDTTLAIVDPASDNTPTGAAIAETDSTALAGRLRQFYLGSPSAPLYTLTVQGPSATGGVPGGSKASLIRLDPPPHFTFDVSAPTGACGPTYLQIHSNNYNLAPATGTDALSVWTPNGSFSDANLPVGQATKKVAFAYDLGCRPTSVDISGATDAEQPDEVVTLLNTWGYQMVVARLSPSFDTRVTFEWDSTSSGEVPAEITVTQENSAANPQQFIQLGQKGSGGTTFGVLTIENGFVPSGALALAGTDTTARAHALDPSAFTLKLDATTANGPAVGISGQNTAVQPAAYVTASKTGIGSITVSNLGLGYNVTATNQGSTGSSQAKITGSTTDNYPNTVVQVSGTFTGVNTAGLVISGPGVATPPTPTGDVQIAWKNAPRSSYSLSLAGDMSAPSTVTIALEVTAGNEEAGGLISGLMSGFTGGICGLLSATECDFRLGGGFKQGTTSYKVTAPTTAAVPPHLHVEGTLTSVPTTEYFQMWTVVNGAPGKMLTVEGPSAAPLLCDCAGSQLTAIYRDMPQTFALDVQLDQQVDDPTGEQKLHMSSTRSSDCQIDACGLTVIYWFDRSQSLAQATVVLSHIPQSVSFSGDLNKKGVGNLDFTASAANTALTLGNGWVTLNTWGLPTQVTARTSGTFGSLDYSSSIDTGGTGTISWWDLVFRNLSINLDKKHFNIGPITGIGPGGNYTLTGTADATLRYEFGAYLHMQDVSSWSIGMAPAQPQLQLPQVVWHAAPVSPTTQAYMWFFGGDGSTPPVECPADLQCDSMKPDTIQWTGVITYTDASAIPIASVDCFQAGNCPSASSPQQGNLDFWGWDSFPASDSYKWQFGEGAGWHSVRENEHEWDSSLTVPFSPAYSISQNFLGSTDNSVQHDRVYVLNPQNWLLRGYDQSSSCPHYRVLFWTTNCYWQVALDLVPAEPSNA